MNAPGAGAVKAGGGKAAAWLAAHKTQAGLGAAAVGAVGIGIARRRKQAGNAQVPVSATTGADTSGIADTSTTAGGVPYSGQVSDDPMVIALSEGLGGISEQLATLTTDVNQLTTPPSKPTTGGTMTKPPAAVKPKLKPARHKAVPVPPLPKKPKPRRLRGRRPVPLPKPPAPRLRT